MISTFLDTHDDLQWLRETHLRGLKLPPFICAIIHGNEDWPTRIWLYANDHYQAEPIAIVELDGDGKPYLVSE